MVGKDYAHLIYVNVLTLYWLPYQARVGVNDHHTRTRVRVKLLHESGKNNS